MSNEELIQALEQLRDNLPQGINDHRLVTLYTRINETEEKLSNDDNYHDRATNGNAMAKRRYENAITIAENEKAENDRQIEEMNNELQNNQLSDEEKRSYQSRIEELQRENFEYDVTIDDNKNNISTLEERISENADINYNEKMADEKTLLELKEKYNSISNNSYILGFEKEHINEIIENLKLNIIEPNEVISYLEKLSEMLNKGYEEIIVDIESETEEIDSQISKISIKENNYLEERLNKQQKLIDDYDKEIAELEKEIAQNNSIGNNIDENGNIIVLGYTTETLKKELQNLKDNRDKNLDINKINEINDLKEKIKKLDNNSKEYNEISEKLQDSIDDLLYENNDYNDLRKHESELLAIKEAMQNSNKYTVSEAINKISEITKNINKVNTNLTQEELDRQRHERLMALYDKEEKEGKSFINGQALDNLEREGIYRPIIEKNETIKNNVIELPIKDSEKEEEYIMAVAFEQANQEQMEQKKGMLTKLKEKLKKHTGAILLVLGVTTGAVGMSVYDNYQNNKEITQEENNQSIDNTNTDVYVDIADAVSTSVDTGLEVEADEITSSETPAPINPFAGETKEAILPITLSDNEVKNFANAVYEGKYGKDNEIIAGLKAELSKLNVENMESYIKKILASAEEIKVEAEAKAKAEAEAKAKAEAEAEEARRAAEAANVVSKEEYEETKKELEEKNITPVSETTTVIEENNEQHVIEEHTEVTGGEIISQTEEVVENNVVQPEPTPVPQPEPTPQPEPQVTVTVQETPTEVITTTTTTTTEEHNDNIIHDTEETGPRNVVTEEIEEEVIPNFDELGIPDFENYIFNPETGAWELPSGPTK